MRYRVLGKTQLDVSEIGFGCWAIGGTSYGPTDDNESMKALETAWEQGVNFYDTADTYGHGHSEELLTKFFKNKPRDKYVLATKAGWDFYHGGSRKNFDLSYLRFACDQSLKRLQTDFIDVFQLHNPSLELIRRGEIIGLLDEIKDKGKIRFIGISVHTEEEALAAMEDTRVDCLQVPYNLLEQRMADRVFPEAVKRNVGLIIREPLACGLLTGKYSADYEFPKTDHRRRWVKEKRELDVKKIEKIKTILSTKRFSLTRAALEFVLDADGISTVIPGAKTSAQALENIQASKDPQLRSQESYLLRELYRREEIFRQGMQA